jgi:hypothetical protein
MNENYNGVGFVPGNRFSDTIDSRNKRPFWGLDVWSTLFESFARTRSSLKIKTVEEKKNGTNFGGSENGA